MLLTVELGIALFGLITVLFFIGEWDTNPVAKRTVTMVWLAGVAAFVGYYAANTWSLTITALALGVLVGRILTRKRANVLELLNQLIGEGFVLRSLGASAASLAAYFIVAGHSTPAGLTLGVVVYVLMVFDALDQLVSATVMGLISIALSLLVNPGLSESALVSLAVAVLAILVIIKAVPEKYRKPVNIVGFLAFLLLASLLNQKAMDVPFQSMMAGMKLLLAFATWNLMLALARVLHGATTGVLRQFLVSGVPALLSMLGSFAVFIFPNSVIAYLGGAWDASCVFFLLILLSRVVGAYLVHVPYYDADGTRSEFDRFEDVGRILLGDDLYSRVEWLLVGQPKSVRWPRAFLPALSFTVLAAAVALRLLGLDWSAIFYRPAGRLSGSLPLLALTSVMTSWLVKYRSRPEARLRSEEAMVDVGQVVAAIVVWLWWDRGYVWPLLQGWNIGANLLAFGLAVAAIVALYEDLCVYRFGLFVRLLSVGLLYCYAVAFGYVLWGRPGIASAVVLIVIGVCAGALLALTGIRVDLLQDRELLKQVFPNASRYVPRTADKLWVWQQHESVKVRATTGGRSIGPFIAAVGFYAFSWYHAAALFLFLGVSSVTAGVLRRLLERRTGDTGSSKVS